MNTQPAASVGQPRTFSARQPCGLPAKRTYERATRTLAAPVATPRSDFYAGAGNPTVANSLLVAKKLAPRRKKVAVLD